MSLNYPDNVDVIIKRLNSAHNPEVSKIRTDFFMEENRFLRDNISGESVIVAGSGLGHDTFELSRYNSEVLGIEILRPLVEISQNKARELGINNVRFHCGDFITYSPEVTYDTCVLNMGTIGNFDDKKKVINSLLGYSRRLYCDFYLGDKPSLKKRKDMYEEEGWKNVRIHGKRIISDDGLDSASLSRLKLSNIVNTLGYSVKYHELNDFSVMAKIYK